MGNKTSNTNTDTNTNEESTPNKNVAEIMDYVATNYILTMDFESLKQLYNKKYCDNLIVLTSDIVQKYFTNTDITYLSDRIKKKDNLIFINRNDVETIDELDPTKKQELCNGIAKFYVTVAHIFASIITTVNPVYIFKDLNGEVKKLSLSERNKIPYGIKTQVMKYNICDNRINSLRNNSLFDKSTGDLTINPSVCNVNLRDDGSLKSLEDEPGIPELIELYNDDNYNYETGTFHGMSEKTKEMFQENLKIFYTTFTGNNDMPPEISKFSDIKLRDYDKDGKCESHLNESISGNISNELFAKYAENLKQMISKTNKNRDGLLNILNELFVYFTDPETKTKRIRVNPNLTEDILKEVILETRSAVIKLYLNCEQDYVEGIKIYEAIVEQKILETSQNQITSLKKMSENLISTDENIPLSEDQVIQNNLQKEQILENAQQQINDLDKSNQQPIMQQMEEEPIQEQPIQEQPQIQEQEQPQIQEQIEPQIQEQIQPIQEQEQIQIQPIQEQIQPQIQEQEQIQIQPIQEQIQPQIQEQIQIQPIQEQEQEQIQPQIQEQEQIQPQIQEQIQPIQEQNMQQFEEILSDDDDEYNDENIEQQLISPPRNLNTLLDERPQPIILKSKTNNSAFLQK